MEKYFSNRSIGNNLRWQTALEIDGNGQIEEIPGNSWYLGLPWEPLKNKEIHENSLIFDSVSIGNMRFLTT